ITLPRGDLLFFFLDQLQYVVARRSETELAIKPERAGLDAFLILVSDLVRIDCERSDAGEIMHHIEDARIQPRGFTAAKRVAKIEAAFHSPEQRKTLEVTDGHAIFVNHRSVICA